MQGEATYVDGRDEAAVDRAPPGAKLIYLESPTSWVMEAHDGALAALARQHGAVSVIDNSWASPISSGRSACVHLVLHSASKYLSGHSDAAAGVVAGPKALIDRIRGESLPYLGAKLSPFDAGLLVRGMHAGRPHEGARSLGAGHRPLPRRPIRPWPPSTTLVSATPCRRGLFRPQGVVLVFALASTSAPFLRPPAPVQSASAGRPREFGGAGRGGAGPQGHAHSAQEFGLDPRSVRLHVGLEGTQGRCGPSRAAITAGRHA